MNQKQLIERILKIENELIIRDANDKLKDYNTGELVHKKQLEFHKCTKRNRWVLEGIERAKRNVVPWRQSILLVAFTLLNKT